MKNPLSKTFVVIFSLFLVISFCFNNGIFAGTTGKVQGTILDSDTKEPLPGVNVILEGTTLGAATDENGFFFIINVPPGTYSLKSSMVGYAIETKEDVRVYVDRTTTTDFGLRTQAIAGEEVTVTATRAPVPLDVSSTEAYVNGEDIAESPAGRFDEMIGYQAGVEFANTNPTQDERGFSVRGGDVSETDVQIDGMSMMNKQTQGVNMPMSRNLIQDVQILTGGFNAEYGNIRSGLINVVTKDGSYNRYSGVLEGRYSPKDYKHWGPHPFDQDTENGNEYAILFWGENAYTGVPKTETYHYRDRPNNNWNYFAEWKGWDSYAQNEPYSAEFYYNRSRWWQRPLPMMTSDDMMTDVAGGGPVPFLNNTKFFISGYWNRSEYPQLSTRSRSHEYNTSVKITKRIKSNMVFVISGFSNFTYGTGTYAGDPSKMGSNRQWRVNILTSNMILGDDKYMYAARAYNFKRLFDNPRFNIQEDRTNTLGLKFTHTLNPSTYYELSATGFIYDSDRHRMKHTDPTNIHFITDSKTGETVGFNEWPLGYSPRSEFGHTKYTPIGFYMRSGAKDIHDNIMNDVQISGNFVSQIDKYNQIKFGFQLSRTYIDNIQQFPGHSVEKLEITEKPKGFGKYTARPWQFEWFIQDKLEWEGMILNFGIRAHTYFPNTNGFNLTYDNMFGYDEEGYPLWYYRDQWGTVEYAENWMFEEMRTRKIKHKVIIQPRIGISHPITGSSKIFFNYGHFFNQPNGHQLFCVMIDKIPVPDLKWPKVIAYEIGYSQSIYNQLLLQISGYYKDYTDEPATFSFESYYGDNSGKSFADLGYRDIRGIEFRIERSFGRFINGWANYNYMVKSYGTTGFENIYQDPALAQEQFYSQVQEKPEILPTFRANISFRTPINWGPGPPILGIKPLAEWRINFLYRWREGGRYLWNPGAPPNSWTYVDRLNITISDLYISKRLARGAQIYCQIMNIFNKKRLEDIGGSYRDSLHLWFEQGEQYGNDKIGDYKADHIYTGQHKWLTFLPDKRDVYFGIRYQF